MILPDVNLLVYAHNEAAPRHASARAWWEETLTREQPVGIAWAVSLGFVRLITHASVLVDPVDPVEALDHVATWLEREHVQVLDPGPRHLAVLRQLFSATGVAGGMTTDTHLAALAIEHQCELLSNDADFARFPGLRWRNPLA
ncbi:MAG: type II toxin-antitoxin system VapC family toxin [Deltaproteobacteria bacterium]|nr:type II toxin-antitoxin system VapC family toxin [Deltaproteobacteria bacterium]